MISFGICLFYLAFCLWVQQKYHLFFMWPLPFWIIPFSLLLSFQNPFSGLNFYSFSVQTYFFLVFSLKVPFAFCLGFLIFCQDLKTRYFSLGWIKIGLALCFMGWTQVALTFRFLGVLFGLFCLTFVFQKKLGLADIIGFILIGLSLGFKGLMEVLMIACLWCLGYSLVFRERLIPFLSFLAWSYCLFLGL